MSDRQENGDSTIDDGTQFPVQVPGSRLVAAGLESPLDPGLPPAQRPLAEKLHRIFFAPAGLRSGWRFVLYLLLFALIQFFLGALIRFGLSYAPHTPGSIWLGLAGELEVLAAALLAAFILAPLEKRAFGDYGLPRRGAFGRPFWSGAVWGFVGITGLLLAISACGDFSFGHIALHGTRILKFAGFWGVYFLAVGLFEEFLFRGFTQAALTQGVGFWPAALFLSTIFGAVHLGNEGEALLGALAAGFIGLFLCLTLRRVGNLWFAVGFHASWDWGESYLYSVPDSGERSPGHLLSSSFHGSRWITGGSVGPEGSVLVFVIVALLWMAFARVYSEVKYPVERT